MVGPDHRASLEPNELKNMVNAIRNIESALGNGVKKPTSIEEKNKKIVRKSIIALKNIKLGEKFSEKNITLKRSDVLGISPMDWEVTIGKVALKEYQQDELI
jgi:N,N'-diacetyllegionaminate synthase